MKMRCPQCGVKGAADDSYVGRKVKCPKCQEVFVLTAESDALENVLPAEVEEITPPASPAEDIQPALDEAEVEESISEDIEDLFDEPVNDDVTEGVDEVESVDSFFTDQDDVPVDDFFNDEEPEEGVVSEIEEPVAEDEPILEDEVIEEDISVPEDAPALEDDKPDSPEIDDFFDQQGEDQIILEQDDELELTEESEPEVEAVTEVFEEDILDSEAIIAEEEDELILDEELAAELEDQEQPEDVVEETAEEAVPELPVDDVVAAPMIEEEGEKKKGMKEEKKAKKEPVKHQFTLEDLTVFGAIKEAWKYTKGAKLTLLLATLAVFVLSAGLNVLVSMGLPFIESSVNTMFPGSQGVAFGWVSGLSMFFASFLSSVFGAGLLYMGVKRVADQPISLGMVFSGLPRVLAIFFGFLFMTLMIISGLVLLVLPGIYLMVGYTLTLPLIIDKKMQPWEAMEASRKAIHKVWWKVLGIFIVMGFILNIAAIPVGLGLIWAIPMYVIVFGVIYRVLFKE